MGRKKRKHEGGGSPGGAAPSARSQNGTFALLLGLVCGGLLLLQSALEPPRVGASPSPLTSAPLASPAAPGMASGPSRPRSSPSPKPTPPPLPVDAVAPSDLRFSGDRAFDQVRSLVELGPRPPGSPASAKAREHIVAELKALGLPVELQRFEGATPDGPVPMVNVLACVGGAGREVVPTRGWFAVAASHYDTKRLEKFRFVGANDGGSSTGALLELARALSSARLRIPIVLAFVDGEEAFHSWTDTDSTYGSRHLARELARKGRLRDVAAFVLLDMIGDRDLHVQVDARGSWLRERVLEEASRLGYGSSFSTDDGFEIDDDHVPFARAGVPTLDLIDFHYGPHNAWWHSPKDTLDKLSPVSLHVVGRVSEALLLDLRPPQPHP